MNAIYCVQEVADDYGEDGEMSVVSPAQPIMYNIRYQRAFTTSDDAAYKSSVLY
jgi:hypothetical protein